MCLQSRVRRTNEAPNERGFWRGRSHVLQDQLLWSGVQQGCVPHRGCSQSELSRNAWWFCGHDLSLLNLNELKISDFNVYFWKLKPGLFVLFVYWLGVWHKTPTYLLYLCRYSLFPFVSGAGHDCCLYLQGTRECHERIKVIISLFVICSQILSEWTEIISLFIILFIVLYFHFLK